MFAYGLKANVDIVIEERAYKIIGTCDLDIEGPYRGFWEICLVERYDVGCAGDYGCGKNVAVVRVGEP